MHITGVQTAKVSSGKGKHRGVTGISKGQGGLGSSSAVVRKSDGETGPPNQGRPGPSVSGYGRALIFSSTRDTIGTHTSASVLCQ